MQVRPFRPEDTAQLDLFRELFLPDGRTDVPFGYANIGVETAIAEKNNKTVGAVTATKSIIVNFMKDPTAAGTDIYAAVLMLERALAYVAQQNGVVEAYCAIPSHLTEYVDMVKRSGYAEAFPDCVILRRALTRETNVSD